MDTQTSAPDAASFQLQTKDHTRSSRIFFFLTNALLIAGWIAFKLYSPHPALLTFDGTQWQTISGAAGSITKVYSSDPATVWVVRESPDGVSRYSQGAWQQFSLTQIGFRPNEILGRLALSGNQAWTWSNDTVFQFDGTNWVRHSGFIGGAGIEDLAVFDDTAWVLDTETRLHQSSGDQWQSSVLSEQGIKAEGPFTFAGARLHALSKTSLWLIALSGVWRFDGTQWQTVIAENPDSLNSFFGAGPNVIWIQQDQELVRFSAAGEELSRVKLPDVMIDRLQWDVQTGVTDTQIRYVKNGQLIAFDGSQESLIKELPALPGGDLNLFSTVLAENGTIWTAAEPQGLGSQSAWFSAFFAFIVVLWGVEWWYKRRQHSKQQQALRDVLTSGAPAVNTGDQRFRASSKVQDTGTAGALFGRIIRWSFYAACWVAVILFYDQIINGLTSISGGALPERLLRWVIVILALALPQIVLAICGVGFVLGALHKAKYDQAISRLRLARMLAPEAAPLIECGILYYSGRYEDAEMRTLNHLERSKVRKSKNTANEATLMALYGYSLLAQGRSDDAERACKGAYELKPDSSSMASCLAEVWLRQDKNYGQALEILDKAKANLAKDVNCAGLSGEVLINRAWALAANRRTEEARAELEAGLKKSLPKRVPEHAMNLYRAGKVLTALGLAGEARMKFETAQQLDPHGAAGDFAAKSMKEIRAKGAAPHPAA